MASRKGAGTSAGQGETGNIVVELALVLPLLLLVLAGIIDLGTLYWEKQVLTNATAAGARSAVRAGAGEAAEQTSSQIRQIVQDQLDRYSLKDAGGNRIVLTPGVNFNYQWDLSVTPAQLWVEIKKISVPMLLLSDVLPLFGGQASSSPPTLQTRTTMAAQWTTPPP